VKNVACQYSFVRFLPYPETGEFANVGVLLACPSTGFFGSKLISHPATNRVLAFFESLDEKILRSALTDLDKELARIGKIVAELYPAQGSALITRFFAEVVRPRESLLRFSAAGAVMSADPKATLDELYIRLVAHAPAASMSQHAASL
jgi:hypothetical protein